MTGAFGGLVAGQPLNLPTLPPQFQLAVQFGVLDGSELPTSNGVLVSVPPR